MVGSTTYQGQAVTTSITADEIYAVAAQASNLWMGKDDEGIRLFRGEVIENDAPGSGRSDQEEIEPFIAVHGRTALRKFFDLDEPTSAGLQLAFIARECENNPAILRFVLNGHQILRTPSRQAEPDARQYWELMVGGWSWSRWYYVEIPPAALRRGQNEVVVSAVDGRAGWQLMVADYRDFYKGMVDPIEEPHTSHHSTDGGATWTEERGEYVMRLALDRFRRRGE